eukprot:TRINITY_DN14724_c0_g1_i2.p1 TRINITY_DN14724_c0_g1~~TRINITY_DN14724_c0_g1_i2.p1  ORF type:complete len:181 (+),score=27.24 TRINITY_DN14724_c0_g1_i2:28-543(+)
MGHARVVQIFQHNEVLFNYGRDHNDPYFEQLGLDYIQESLAGDLASPAALRAEFLTRQDSPRDHFWVVETNESIIGGMVALQCLDPERKIGELRRMSVDKPFRRQKLGSKLMLNLVEFARSEGYDSVVLTTPEVNEPAIRLYQRFGFQIVHRFQYQETSLYIVKLEWKREP